MKVGIITFHASHNYGSMLQAWALQTYIQSMGHEAEIINFRPEIQKRMYRGPFSLRSRYDVKNIFRRLFHSPFSFIHEQKRWARFEKFLRDEMHTSEEYPDQKQLSAVGGRFDTVVCGSDQIWISYNEGCSAYFGDFVPENVKKIAYAASMGPKPQQQIDKEYVKANLRNFDAISVREPATKDFIDGLMEDEKTRKSVFRNAEAHKEIEVVCDPTLLLQASDYEKITAPSSFSPKEEYIFLYCPSPDSSLLELASAAGEIFHLPIFTDRPFIKGENKRFPNIHYWPSVGPREFLRMIENAALTCGSSFHLLAFSLLFHKKMLCLKGAADSRIMNLLSRIHLEALAVDSEEQIRKAGNMEIDFGKADADLTVYVQSGKSFLKDNLGQK